MTQEDAGAPSVFEPSAPWWGAFLVGSVVGLVAMIMQAGERLLSAAGTVTLVIGLVVMAYLALFAFRLWVYLYNDRLEIHPSLAKLVRDRIGVSLYTPKIVYYRHVVALRRTRGFGGYNALVVVRRASGWQRSEYGIPLAGVRRYDELERELVRRVPPDCDLHSIDLLGHRGSFD